MIEFYGGLVGYEILPDNDNQAKNAEEKSESAKGEEYEEIGISNHEEHPYPLVGGLDG